MGGIRRQRKGKMGEGRDMGRIIRTEKGGGNKERERWEKKGERERGRGKWVMVGTRERYKDRERWEK